MNGIDGEARDSPEGGDEPDAVDAGQEDGQDDEAGRLPADAAAAVRVVVGADDAQVGRHGRQRRQHHEAHGVADQVVGVARRVRVHQPLPQRQPKKHSISFEIEQSVKERSATVLSAPEIRDST